MKELVDKEKLRDVIDELAEDDGDREIVQVDGLLSRLKDCTLSSAELGGDSWVLEKLKEKLKEYKLEEIKKPVTKPAQAYSLGWQEALKNIYVIITKSLESQAPVSELAKQAEEDKRRAEAWEDLYNHLVDSINGVAEEPLASLIDVRKEMNNLLVQSKIPPEAEEEKR